MKFYYVIVEIKALTCLYAFCIKLHSFRSLTAKTRQYNYFSNLTIIALFFMNYFNDL